MALVQALAQAPAHMTMTTMETMTLAELQVMAMIVHGRFLFVMIGLAFHLMNVSILIWPGSSSEKRVGMLRSNGKSRTLHGGHRTTSGTVFNKLNATGTAAVGLKKPMTTAIPGDGVTMSPKQLLPNLTSRTRPDQLPSTTQDSVPNICQDIKAGPTNQ